MLNNLAKILNLWDFANILHPDSLTPFFINLQSKIYNSQSLPTLRGVVNQLLLDWPGF
jgi:hypothetical protein